MIEIILLRLEIIHNKLKKYIIIRYNGLRYEKSFQCFNLLYIYIFKINIINEIYCITGAKAAHKKRNKCIPHQNMKFITH